MAHESFPTDSLQISQEGVDKIIDTAARDLIDYRQMDATITARGIDYVEASAAERAKASRIFSSTKQHKQALFGNVNLLASLLDDVLIHPTGTPWLQVIEDRAQAVTLDGPSPHSI
jgi:hypothetical protein